MDYCCGRCDGFNDECIDECKEKIFDVKKRIEELRSERKIYIDIPKKKTGGQQCGMPVHPTVVEHEDLGIKISIKAHRSNFKNKDLAVLLFDMAFDELIR